MRPSILTMQAFGPFAGTERINFADLGESPLFLINGPTGSGKTTILDAICYALYGSTTGNERDAKEMRCQQSDPNLLTEVTFEFSLGGSSYRITRSPDQDRPKLRGDGITKHPSRADLYQLGPDGTIDTGELLVEKKISEATEYIRSITGMNADQFRQVMVLPQGQFRKLLMADSKDKQKIFESLFETTIYTKIEERLKEDSKDIRDSVAHGQSVILNIMETGGVTDSADLLAQIDTTSSELSERTTAKDTANMAWQAAERALDDANKLKTDFDTLEQVKAQENTLKARLPEINADRAQAKLARAADKLKPIYDRFNEAQTALSKSKQEVAEAEQALAIAEKDKKFADTAYKVENARGKERAAAAAAFHQLQSYAGKAEVLVEAKTAVNAAMEKEGSSKTALMEREKALTKHVEAEAPLHQKIDALEKAIGDAKGIDLTLHKLKEALTAKKQLTTTEENEAKAAKALVNARDRLSKVETSRDNADKILKRLRQGWHQGQAALLAQELEEGRPCPVCGSAEHPAPAQKADQAVTEDQLEEATAKLDAHTKAVIDTSGEVTTYAERVESLHAQKGKHLTDLGDWAQLTEQDINTQLDEATLRANKLADDQTTLVAARNNLKKHAEALVELRQTTELAKADLIVKQQDVGKAQTRFELSEQALPEPYREVGLLERALASANAALSNLEAQLEQARKAFEKADKGKGEAAVSLTGLQRVNKTLEERLASAKDARTDALATSVFNTEQEMMLASMSEIALAELDRQIAAHDKKVLENNATRVALENQLKGKMPGNLPALQEAEEAARSKRDETTESWRTSDQRMTRLNDTKRNLETKQAEMADLDAKYRVVGTLADVACGLKGLKISLQRYILGVLLDDVLVQSTQRLIKMSDGRYELRRKLDPSKGKRASGLDLEVYDDYSGESRSVATLSGGESFMAALSLALGLSDVVQAQTGGIQLDTLFVDEGFGTLDSEALELAVSTLMDLQKAGRMVGIISHVSELKEQMDVRIDLRKSNQGGSSLRVVSPMMGGI